MSVREGELKAGDIVRLSRKKLDRHARELDGEGVAYADGSFYVIGSHGHPRDKDRKLNADEIAARIAASSQVVRIRLRTGSGEELCEEDVLDVEASSKLRPVIAAQPSLQPFLDERLERNGLTIEGVAVLGDIFYAGFRSPSLEDGMSPLLSVRLDAIFGSQPAQPLNRWDCRWAKAAVFVRWRASREDCSFWPGQQLPEQEHSVHWWSPTTGGTQFLADITKPAEAGKDSKPEAIPPLDKSTSGLRLLVFSDGEKEGAPRPIVGPAPDTAAGELRCSRSLDRRKLEFSGFFMMASWARHRDSAT